MSSESTKPCGDDQPDTYSGFLKSTGWTVWECSADEHLGELHVTPDYDERQHELAQECRCRPQMDHEGVWVHRAFDQRDLYEEGRRKPH